MAKLEGGTLGIDVGGSGIKGMVLDPDGTPLNERVRIETPRPANPETVLKTIGEVAEKQPPFERVSIGFPGVVQFGVVKTAPNLDGDWTDVPLAAEVERMTGRPCRAANDADVQGYGVIEGKGTEMVLTLGTGMGAAVFTNGHLTANLELGHHPLMKGKTYEELVGQAARKKVGDKKWNKRVAKAIAQILPIWNPRVLYVGGGNVKKLTVKLPENVKRVENVAGILGGIRLWEDETHVVDEEPDEMGKEVRQDDTGNLQVRFPFDRALVDLIKTLPSRRWNAAERYWEVPVGDVALLVEMLQPLGFRFDGGTARAYGEAGGKLQLDDAPPGPATAPELPGLFDGPSAGPSSEPAATAATDYTVSSLNRQVKAAIEAAFPQAVWLVGEISGFNRNAHKRHVTFKLVEHDEQGKSVSEVDATLFEQSRKAIERALSTAGDPFRLEDEIAVRLRARVELYVPWGSYRILVEQLDPSYTLGEAARRREEIVRRLREAGLSERNRSLEFPPLPLRVGLITSLGSDAHKDVLRTFEESGYAFDVVCHGARVQGRATEPSVLNALDYFGERASAFDVALICRGGGSRTDLAWFDSEALGRAVALFPLPVVVGIGHEQDLSVLDEVGWRCKTPTAAAAFLVETVRRSLEALERDCEAILELASRRLEEERRRQADRGRRLALGSRALLDKHLSELVHRRGRAGRAATVHLARQRLFLDNARRAMIQASRREIDETRRRLDEAARLVGPRAQRMLSAETERMTARGRRLHLVDPRRVVERGYAILRSSGGGVLTQAARAPAGTALSAELRDGRLALRSEGALESKMEEAADGQED